MSEEFDDVDGKDEPRAELTKMTREQMKVAAQMTKEEARHLVDNYYIMQHNRMRADSQIRSMADEPHVTIDHLSTQSALLEAQTKTALQWWVKEQPVGQWLLGITGIGPVLAAGLLAHLDIEHSPTAGHIWAFAGFDPTRKWEKGKKRPHNARLKTLCWKVGESFVKNCNRESCFYGHVYKERKQSEEQKNNALEFKAQAERILSEKNYSKDTEAYKAYIQGKLPPAHIHARARRYAVKLFLAHLHRELYVHHFKKEPPLPYPIAHLGHVHMIRAENETPLPEA